MTDASAAARAARSASLPLVGREAAGGAASRAKRAAACPTAPLPHPLPTRGRGGARTGALCP
jgi:hypothetical protein